VSAKTEEYTFGVKEEYQIIDPETRGLSPRGEGVLRRARQARSKGVIDHAPSGLRSLIYGYDEFIVDASATHVRTRRAQPYSSGTNE
jgi:gamma-glutamyl:cysteine ligase YbdK (ATP-grasp superfamily)